MSIVLCDYHYINITTINGRWQLLMSLSCVMRVICFSDDDGISGNDVLIIIIILVLIFAISALQHLMLAYL